MDDDQIEALSRFFRMGIVIALAVLVVLLLPAGIEKIQLLLGF